MAVPRGRSMLKRTLPFLAAAIVLALLCGAAECALPALYSQPGPYGVGSTVVTIMRTGLGVFQATVYFPTPQGTGGACTDVASCYLQSIATSGASELAPGRFPMVIFGLNTFISGQEVYGSTMRHIASHGFVVCATNSRYIQPAAEAVEMVDCVNYIQAEVAKPGSMFYNKVNFDVGVGTLGYSQGGAASLDSAALLGDRCAACITQHAQPSMQVRTIKCPIFLHSGDGDSLTGIMKAMIWSGASVPRVFAIMRGAHHLTPVPPSPWDPWSLAWLRLYQQGDMAAGPYIWGSVPGSLRAENTPVGTMSEVLFDPVVPWSPPYTQYGIGGRGLALPQMQPGVQPAVVPQQPAVPGQAGAAAMQPTQTPSMWGGMMPGMGGGGMDFQSLFANFMGGGAGGGGQPSYLSAFMPGLSQAQSPTATQMPATPGMAAVQPGMQPGMQSPSMLQAQIQTPQVSPMVSPQQMGMEGTMTPGLGNTFQNTATSLSGVYQVPVSPSIMPPQTVMPPVTASSLASPTPSMQPPTGTQPSFSPSQPQQSASWSGGLYSQGGPFCTSNADCCSPGICVAVRGSAGDTKMCSLPSGGLGKLAGDRTCGLSLPPPSPSRGVGRRVSDPETEGKTLGEMSGTLVEVEKVEIERIGSDEEGGLWDQERPLAAYKEQQFALAVRPAQEVGGWPWEEDEEEEEAERRERTGDRDDDRDRSDGSMERPDRSEQSLAESSGQGGSSADGPRLSLIDCGDTLTLEVEGGSPGSQVLVIGSNYSPKTSDQLSLLSNTECPVIDVGIKIPRQRHSSDFLKSALAQAGPKGTATVVFDNTFGEACLDFVYQAVDTKKCVAGPVLDTRD